MNNTIVLDVAWGDCGKAKITDFLADKADATVRFAGSVNCGHSVVINGTKHIFRLIPSGAFHPNVKCIIGNGVIIEPQTLKQEIETLEAAGISIRDRLFISDSCQILFPYHRNADEAFERGKNAIGTTKKGVGPNIIDKVARRGIRAIDLKDIDKTFKKQQDNAAIWYMAANLLTGALGVDKSFIEQSANVILPYICDTVKLINQLSKQDKFIILEGSQGTLLDIDFGSYPYVTSTNASVGGAITGTGLPANAITKVIGVSKAYITRVGSGPFPTELFDEDGKKLQDVGKEIGSVTKRARRVGWLDLPLLKYARDINGLDELALTKLDVLTGMDYKVCIDYEGEFSIHTLDIAKPIYKEFKRWDKDISNVKEFNDLPIQAQDFITFLEDEIEVPITMVGVGPDRKEIILR